MAGYWPRFVDQDGVKVHKLIKKERSRYPAILTEQAWLIKDLFYGFRGNFSCGTRRVVSSGQDSSILSAQVANHSAGFDSSGYCPKERQRAKLHDFRHASKDKCRLAFQIRNFIDLPFCTFNSKY